MLGLHSLDGVRAAPVILGVALFMLFVFFAAVAAGQGRGLPHRRRFYAGDPFGRRSWKPDFGLADPTCQLHAVEAASFHKQRVLSRAEYRVFKIIENEMAIIGEGHRVFAQTSLGEILKSPGNDSAFHAINSKRADILVIDRGGWPVLAVEYQGEGNYRNTAATRDAIKKEALRKAGVKYLEVFQTDSDDDIRSRVRGQLGWTMVTVAPRAPATSLH